MQFHSLTGGMAITTIVFWTLFWTLRQLITDWALHNSIKLCEVGHLAAEVILEFFANVVRIRLNY